jgi:hypothetical protein
VGSGPPGAGGQITWPRAIAGTAKRAVTRATLIQGFMRVTPFAGRGEGLASESCIFTRSPKCLASSGRVGVDRFSSFPVDFGLSLYQLYASRQDVVVTSKLNDLVRGPAPSRGEGLCGILDLNFPEFLTSSAQLGV